MPTEPRIKNAVQRAEYNAYLMNRSKQDIFQLSLRLDRNSRCPALRSPKIVRTTTASQLFESIETIHYKNSRNRYILKSS